METIKQIVVSAIVAAFVATIGLTVNHPNYGAVASPEMPFDHITVGGLTQYSFRAPISSTSSVPCAYQAQATSTVDRLGLLVDGNGYAKNVTLDISTSTSAFGSSTTAFVFAATIIAAPTAAAPQILAWQPGISTTTNGGLLGSAPTIATGTSPFVVQANDWITWRIATGSPGTTASGLTGYCSARVTAL